MKFIISPSKTMNNVKTKKTQTPLFKSLQEPLLSALKALDIKALMTLFKVKEPLAKETYTRFLEFTENSEALYSYTGYQFKALEVETLDEASIDYLRAHLLIMSGLYGLVRPSDTIGLYRLPMDVSLLGDKLYHYWRPSITNYLEGETVVNLASKEYSQSIDEDKVTMIDVYFYVEKDGKRKAHAMHVKKMRGLMIRYAALHNVSAVKQLKAFKAENTHFLEDESTDNTLVFLTRH